MQLQLNLFVLLQVLHVNRVAEDDQLHVPVIWALLQSDSVRFFQKQLLDEQVWNHSGPVIRYFHVRCRVEDCTVFKQVGLFYVYLREQKQVLSNRVHRLRALRHQFRGCRLALYVLLCSILAAVNMLLVQGKLLVAYRTAKRAARILVW